MRWLPLTVVFGFLFAQGVVYPQDKPAAAREKLPAPKINTATDSVAFNDDWRRVAQLGIDEAKMQFMRAYEQVDFDTWDRIVTQNRREMEAYYQKWDNHPIKGNGPTFREFVRRALDANVPKVRDDFYKKYGVPKRKVPGVPSQYGPTFRQIAERQWYSEKGGQVLKWGIGIAVFAWLIAVLRRQKKPEPPPAPMVSDTYGTAAYAPQWKGIPNENYPFRGVFFGKSSHPDLNGRRWQSDPGAPVFSLPENHTIIISKTRTGKGTRVITPTLLRYFGSMLVIDPKGENAAVTARARYNVIEGLPFHVEILNPWGVLDGHFKGLGFERFASYNPLEILDRNDPNAVANAQTLASTICVTGGGDKDRFWQSSAANILAAVLLWITDQPGEKKTLARAREITSLSRRQFSEEFMARMSASEAFDGAIREMISPYIDLANETYSGIMSNLSESMKFLSDPQVKQATGTSSFSMKDLIDLPITVYVIIPPERMETQRTWLRLLLTAGTLAFKNAPLATRQTAQRCMFLIDEFPALGYMPNFLTDIATMAGYGVDYTLIVQGLDQLKAHYKEGAGTILSNCSFKWFCNVNDLESAKYLSESLGKKTVATTGHSKSTGLSPTGQTEGESTTEGETGRNLLNPDEILNLGRDVAIVLNPLVKPQYVRPVDYWNLAEYFPAFRENHPRMFWKPPLKYDPNPYIKSSVKQS